ncbi:MAG: hypothetical protein WC841_03795 [Candidatus Shapirobacteria bacterium]|jgi:hypothetical protein
MKKIMGIGLILVIGIMAGGCLQKETGTAEGAKNVPKPQERSGNCTEEAVEIEGYGDKGKRLNNCFVEYPGEPSREDKSYYIVEDICGQFTREFVENKLGKTITRIEPSDIGGLYNCRYFLNESDEYVVISLEYLTIENQKKGHESMGRKTETSEKIPMRNLLVWQEDGALNSLYLVLGDEKFISIGRSPDSGLTADELIGLAAEIALEIKNYK